MKRASVAVLSLLLVLGLSTVAYAGPGSVVVKTDGDITATFGAQVRMIPTYEQDWDFGIAKSNGAVTATLTHSNEAGTVNKSYVRTEDRLFFNFAKGDIWDVYMNLEFDDVFSSRVMDRVRDTQGVFSYFGLEHIQASVKLPWIYSRFNTGWVPYSVDQDLGVLVYMDDDPGFWLTGGVANLGWKVAYHKKIEANRTLATIRGAVPPGNILNTGSDNDRDVVSARFDYTITKDTQVGLIFAWNHQHAATANFVNADPCVGPVCPETDGYYIAPFVKLGFAGFKFVAEYSHLWGDANKTTILNAKSGPKGNYEIDSNAVYADLSFDMSPWTGFRFIPHIGGWWTQGDKSPDDNKLEGYTGATNYQRFNPAFGGENTIMADGNTVFGTILYGFMPDQRGNQNAAVASGGSNQTGRGDNPGIVIAGGGITIEPIKNWVYRTNAMYLRYNEDFCLIAVNAAGVCAPTSSGAPNLIKARDAGVEWDNEVSWWLDKNMVVKGQFSFLFPGNAIKQVTRALANNGSQPEDTAIRLAMELIWLF